MTDNDIIKAFIETYEQYNAKGDGRTFVYKEVLNLINRQKAEIEKLENIERIATKLIETQKAEIEKLKDEKLKHFLAYEKDRKRIKSEAIKEFAERLKKVMVATHKDTNGYCQYRTEDCEIDNLVKEMVGDAE